MKTPTLSIPIGFSILAFSIGCGVPLKDVLPEKKNVNLSYHMSNQGLIEAERSYSFHEVIYTTQPGGAGSVMQICDGLLLATDSGSFKFEMGAKSLGSPFWIYFDPEDRILVGFPDSKTVYKAGADLMNDPEAAPLLATLDGVRILLGLSDVWSKSSLYGMEPNERTGSVTFQQPGRPYEWTISFLDASSDSAGTGNAAPFEKMEARAGFKTLSKIGRKKSSLQEETLSNKGLDGPKREGHAIDPNLWVLSMEGAVADAQLNFLPQGENDMTEDEIRGHLDPSRLEEGMAIKPLTLLQIKRWLNLR